MNKQKQKMNKKREFYLKELLKTELRIDKYSRNLNNLKRVLMVKEKSIIKASAIIMKNFFKIDFRWKVKTFLGRKIEVYLADADASSLLFFGSLFGDELQVIKFLIKNLRENDIFYDIGSNYGFYTLLAQELITNGEIHSFEPLPKIFDLLRRNANLEKNPNTFLNNVALSNQVGEAIFYNREVARHTGTSSLIFQRDNPEKYIIIKIKTTTLDEYTKTHKAPSIIKLDVEGAEFLVLEGGLSTIKNFKPIIIMEFFNDDLHQKAVNILLNNHYNIFEIDNNGDLKRISSETLQKIFKNQIKSSANYLFKV